MRYLHIEYSRNCGLNSHKRTAIPTNRNKNRLSMKYLGSFLALAAALVLVIFYVSGTTENTLLFIAIILLVAAVIVPCIMNWIKNR